ncbi:hypothetical protein DUNSADRAFT_2476 [Dunaliella salina]|uniref:Uncharacterized protein n=1 Tax=Dunaliella salina TaxID=3046 RepID=A0ABQ7GVK8_DUNSA|nr:hypothetical protein DUNSADRAFT_2476 [Dunaliella salina]|eukprot:KAF5838641.1 hypothetical protein DUNSADRAFT_2476 [Dunaliella salina]
MRTSTIAGGCALNAGAEILTIGVELLRRGHRMVALVADGCAEEARQLLRSDKFLDPLPEPSTNGAGFVNSTGTPTTSRSSSSSSNSSSSSSSSAGTSMGAKEVGGSCGSMGPIEGEEGGLSKGSCSLGEAGFEAGKGEGGLGVHEEDDVSPQQQQQQEQEQEKQEKDRQLQQQQQQQQQRKASRDALLQSMKLVVYPGHVSLEEFVATKVMCVSRVRVLYAFSGIPREPSVINRSVFWVFNCSVHYASLIWNIQEAGKAANTANTGAESVRTRDYFSPLFSRQRTPSAPASAA